jgi:hypothetical protein
VSSDNSGLVHGDTGDHHFPKNTQSDAAANNTADPAAAAYQGEQLLSEIAEEDSISMVSDRQVGAKRRPSGKSRTSGITGLSGIEERQSQVSNSSIKLKPESDSQKQSQNVLNNIQIQPISASRRRGQVTINSQSSNNSLSTVHT